MLCCTTQIPLQGRTFAPATKGTISGQPSAVSPFRCCFSYTEPPCPRPCLSGDGQCSVTGWGKSIKGLLFNLTQDTLTGHFSSRAPHGISRGSQACVVAQLPLPSPASSCPPEVLNQGCSLSNILITEVCFPKTSNFDAIFMLMTQILYQQSKPLL